MLVRALLCLIMTGLFVDVPHLSFCGQAQAQNLDNRDEDRDERRERNREDRGRRSRNRSDNWNPEEYLTRMDSNGDGKLDEGEISDRAERYLSRMGFDTSKPISLTEVTEKIKADRGESTTSAKKEAEPRRVPGFGSTKEKVPGFSSKAEKEDLSSFGEGIIRRVDWVIDNYDRNGNKLLDTDEIKEIPAGPPPMLESDTNRDGKLSRMELANRYRAREQFTQRNENGNAAERGPSDEANSVRANLGRGRFASDAADIATTPPRRPRNNDRVPYQTQRDRSPSQSDRKRTSDYVKNIIQKYDSDKDGKLSEAEIQAGGIRNPPPLNQDGFVTQESYVQFLLDPNKWSGSSNNSKNNDNSKAQPNNNDNTQLSKSKKNTDSDSAKPKTSFEDYDIDASGMIEMHEFASEWDDATLTKFYNKDKNRDGVITSREWSSN